MVDDVELHVKNCFVCQLDKVGRCVEASLLQPLAVPEKPWVSVFMGFAYVFPKANEYVSIMVVVDRFSKYAIFHHLAKNCPVEAATKPFYRSIVKLFGISTEIVSDQYARFTSNFWTCLFGLLGFRIEVLNG